MKWSGAERRRFVRARYPCKISISPPQEHTIFTHTEDIGAGGVRVIIEERLEVSSLIGLEIHLQEKPITCKGRVVWVVEKKSHYQDGFVFFDTGIEFYKINEEDRETINNFINSL